MIKDISPFKLHPEQHKKCLNYLGSGMCCRTVSELFVLAVCYPRGWVWLGLEVIGLKEILV
jgi:hypothetical protein